MSELKDTINILEGQTPFFIARPKGGSKDILLREDISAAVLNVFDPRSATPNTAVFTKTLLLTTDPPVTDECMFSAVQKNGWWDVDEDGFTFWYGLYPVDFTFIGSKTYRVEVELTAGDVGGDAFPLLADYGVLPMIWFVVVEGRA